MEQWWGLRTCVSTRPAQLPEFKQEYRRISRTVVGILPWRISDLPVRVGGICRGSPAGSAPPRNLCTNPRTGLDTLLVNVMVDNAIVTWSHLCGGGLPFTLAPTPAHALRSCTVSPGTTPKPRHLLPCSRPRPSVRGRWLNCCPIQGRVWGEEDGPSPIR